MDKQYIEDNDIAAKYLRGDLTPEEASDFEIYLIDKPDLIEQLEMDGLLFKKLPQLEELTKPQKAKFHWFFGFSWQTSLVTIAICMLGAQFIFYSNFYYQPRIDPRPVFVENMTTRGSQDESASRRTITYQKNESQVILILNPEDEIATEFDIVIRKLANRSVIRNISIIRRGDHGYITIILQKNIMSEDDYSIEMIALNGSLTTEVLPVRFKFLWNTHKTIKDECRT